MEEITKQAVLDYLWISNTNDPKFPWSTVPGGQMGFTKRWGLGLIPVVYQDNGRDRVVMAMNQIETRLGKIFDRQPYAQGQAQHLVQRGIVISTGTAMASDDTLPCNNCGNVSRGPNDTAYPANYFDPLTGIIDCVLYINLDSPDCTADVYTVLHEFGHALGLGEHFEGFGIGGEHAVGTNIFPVLKTLYAHEPGTSHGSINVVL